MWDEEKVRRYEGWFLTPVGRFALEREKRLLGAMIADWPRRQQKLLEIGCGTGVFTESFWRAGFEVSGLDKSPDMLNAARRRLDKNAELHVGDAAHLPFQDNEFDFSVLVTVLEFCKDPAAVLQEAARVAQKGLLVGFLNSWSLYGICHSRLWPWGVKGALDKATWYSWPKLHRLILTSVGHRAAKVRSVLPGPIWTWQEKAPWKHLNSYIYPPYVGAFTVARVDFLGERPVTPLHAWKTEPSAG